MDAGDADLEAVLVAGLDDERVLAVFALRVREASTRASVREASTRASGRARGRGDDGGGSRMDAGDADLELVLVAGLDDERVVTESSLRARAKRGPERRAARARTRRRRMGNSDGRGRR